MKVGFADSIPEDKIKDFGTHYKEYYKLEMEFFMTSTESDLINICWTRFWKTILEADRLIDNKEDYRKTLADLVAKSKKMRSSGGLSLGTLIGKKGDDAESDQRIKDLTKYSMEISQAAHQDCIKALIFN